MKRVPAFLCLLLLVSMMLQSIQHSPVAASQGTAGQQIVYLPIIFKNLGAETTANDYVRPYTSLFQYGLNPGSYGNGWDDTKIYQLCYNAGCRTTRNTLPDSFIAQWGAGIRLSVFQNITSTMGFQEITTFLQTPRAEWRETASFDGYQSKLWQGMYEPIWDNGENGTPVNDANRFALYVWTIVNTYGPYIRFYEIINEPDYTSSSYGWVSPGTAGSWWDNPPQPKDLPNLCAPVYQYIRLLRIAYAVVKRYDPDAYVTPGGLGYPSFLDALLRYTDNPDQGKVTAAYPLTGGAYFDALSFHLYPQYGARYWNGKQWVPDRHSDRAVQVLLDAKQGHEAVLEKHGYDGSSYPRKVFILTEINVARKQIGETLGGIEVQRNFTIKALVKAQQLDVSQLYWFATGEGKSYDDPTAGPYELMGFYETLKRDAPWTQKITQQGIANRTTFQELYGWRYDAPATHALQLPSTVDGGVFRKGSDLRYVLWAKTTADRSEAASATFQMPGGGKYQVVAWDGTTQVISNGSVSLTGAPVFLTPVLP